MMFTVENTWSPPTAVALWGNDSSDEEIDSEEIRWLKQTYIWGTNNEEDTDHECSTNHEEDTPLNGNRKGVFKPSRHICYHTPNKGCAEDARIGNPPRRQRYRHKKRKTRKEVLPPIKVKQGKPEKGDHDMNGASVRLPSLASLSLESPVHSESLNRKNPLQVSKFKTGKKYHYPNVEGKVPRTSQRLFGFIEGRNSPSEASTTPQNEKNYKTELVSSEDVILNISSPETTNANSFQTKNTDNKRSAIIDADSIKSVKIKHGPMKGLFKDIYLKTQSSASNEIKGSNENTHKIIQSDDKLLKIKKEQNLEMYASKLSATNKAQIVSSHFSRQPKNLDERKSSSCGGNVAPMLSYSQRFKNVKNKFVFCNGVLSHRRFDEEDESDVDEESGSSSFDDSDSDDDSEDESVQSSVSGGHSSLSSDNVNDSLSEDEHETKTKKKSTFKYTTKSFSNFSYRKPPERVKLETNTITVSKKTIKRNVAKSVRWAVKLVKIRYFQRDVRSSNSTSDSN